MHKIERLLQTLAPKGVEFRKLGDIGEYIRGVTYKKNQEINNLECGIKVLRANNITLSNYLNFEDIKVINKNVKIRKEQYLKKNDILICAGSGSSEHIGKVAFINTDFDYVFGGFMGVIRIREINSRFVYHIFTSNIFKQYLEKSLNTTTINNLNANILQNFLIPIPPLEIQQEIVTILDAFTELNTELNARKKQYEYYQNMLLDFNDINQSRKDAKKKLAQKPYPKRLKTLLHTLAPKGVGFRKLGEVLEYDQPNKYCVTSKEFDKSYPTPVLTAGKTFILGYTNEKDNIYQASKSSPVIIFDDFTTATQWVDFPFKVKSSAMKILLPKNPTINIRFIFFYMQTIPYNIGGEHARHWISRYSQLEVPIPPLEIQQEIVTILDQFSALTTDLQAGIPAEIKARKKQYEYYREKLLTFKPLTPNKGVKK
ncbi:restriction endonuclease subunit S [Helicobacter pylori]|uniref:restriction endonuclease subunit S n=1 Tax=Helicobacter pylori TaxID=210 RepID=UPI00165B7852|nr:restriction endonuclease subunit S [Helicobacter pylori]